MIRLEARHRSVLIALALLGVFAVSERWLRARRPTPAELRAGQHIVVFSAKDGGPGSLREAIFSADRAKGPAMITLRVRRVVLTSPLPPLVNPKGVLVDGGPFGCELDARALPAGPVIEIQSPNSVVEGFTIRGAAGIGTLIRARGVHLRRMVFSNCAEGLTLGEEASGALVEESRFENNGIGVKVPRQARQVTLRRNRFSGNDQAAIWAVSPEPLTRAWSTTLVVRDNQFDGDRISVVLIHTGARVEHNEFRRAREAAIYMMGSGAVVRENRTSDGGGSGILADQSEGTLIEGNELDHNAAAGILLRSGRGNVVQKNRMYRNGYGIAVIFGERSRPNLVAGNLLLAQLQDALYVIGASPLIRGNRAIQNRAAGLRVLDFVPRKGPRVAAEPLLVENVLEGNRFDRCVRGVYRVSAEEERAVR